MEDHNPVQAPKKAKRRGRKKKLNKSFFLRGIITILPDQSDDSKADTLLHEIIHGVELLSDMKLRETEVLRIATGLRSVLKGRNVLCKYLFSLK